MKSHKLIQQLLIVNISRLSRDLKLDNMRACPSASFMRFPKKYSKLLKTNRIENGEERGTKKLRVRANDSIE